MGHVRMWDSAAAGLCEHATFRSVKVHLKVIAMLKILRLHKAFVSALTQHWIFIAILDPPIVLGILQLLCFDVTGQSCCRYRYSVFRVTRFDTCVCLSVCLCISAVQSQNAVSAYFTSKQILPFGFVELSVSVSVCLSVYRWLTQLSYTPPDTTTKNNTRSSKVTNETNTQTFI